MSENPNPLDYRIVGRAHGDSIELAWQGCLEAGEPRPGVQPPPRCQLVDPPKPPHDHGSWSDLWTARLDFGEAVGWPTHHDGTRQWYQFIGISTPVSSS